MFDWKLELQRAVCWCNRGDNSLIVMGVVLAPLLAVIGIGWIGSVV